MSPYSSPAIRLVSAGTELSRTILKELLRMGPFQREHQFVEPRADARNRFKQSETRETLGLTGHEVFNIDGVATLAPRKDIQVTAKSSDGKEKKFTVVARVDTPEEVNYYKHGGILQYVLRQML